MSEKVRNAATSAPLKKKKKERLIIALSSGEKENRGKGSPTVANVAREGVTVVSKGRLRS